MASVTNGHHSNAIARQLVRALHGQWYGKYGDGLLPRTPRSQTIAFHKAKRTMKCWFVALLVAQETA